MLSLFLQNILTQTSKNGNTYVILCSFLEIHFKIFCNEKKETFRIILLRTDTSAVYTRGISILGGTSSLHTLYIFQLNHVELSLGFLNNSWSRVPTFSSKELESIEAKLLSTYEYYWHTYLVPFRIWTFESTI